MPENRSRSEISQEMKRLQESQNDFMGPKLKKWVVNIFSY
jgi:hypothetical protein